MAAQQELQVQQKREIETKEESTVPARTYGRVARRNFTSGRSQVGSRTGAPV